jgi:hypothetical protein
VAQAIDAHREEKWQYNKEKAIMGRKRKWIIIHIKKY